MNLNMHNKKTNMNWFLPASVDAGLLALCPALEERGEIVTYNGKRYYLRRTRIGMDDKEVIFIKRIKT